jgi:PBP1b-binding outer membrane lipoprotein LpoB
MKKRMFIAGLMIIVIVLLQSCISEPSKKNQPKALPDEVSSKDTISFGTQPEAPGNEGAITPDFSDTVPLP